MQLPKYESKGGNTPYISPTFSLSFIVLSPCHRELPRHWMNIGFINKRSEQLLRTCTFSRLRHRIQSLKKMSGEAGVSDLRLWTFYTEDGDEESTRLPQSEKWKKVI